MKIAIFHDFFGTIGGSEKLVLEIAKAFNADIITTDKNQENIKRLGIKGIKIISLGETVKFPILKQIHASYKFSKAPFKDHDLYIISGCWSIFVAKNHQPNLFYCHTPVRMFYSHYEDFKRICPNVFLPFFILWVKIHRFFLEKNLKYINKIVTNSKNTQKRIKKYYNRDSKVIYPPIKQYKFKKYGDFWLSVNRIYPHKRIELQIEAFRQLPTEKLYIVGGIAKGDYAKKYYKQLLRNLPNNVIFLGEVTEKRLEELYGRCKAFITTSKDEDFGMNVLEANSAGKMVIAINEGGYKETIINDQNGFLVIPTVIEIIEKIKIISKNPSKYKKECQDQGKRYNLRVYLEKIKDEIKNFNRKL